MKKNKLATEESSLEKYYTFFENEKWKDAKNELLKIISRRKIKGFWLYTALSSCYYALEDYKNALRYSKLAYKINPKSSLVLWDYAGVLIMLKKETEAIKLYKRILSKSALYIGTIETTEGLKWSSSLLNDTKLKIGFAYFRIGKDKWAKKYYLEHLRNRKQGLPSLYSKNSVLKILKKLD